MTGNSTSERTGRRAGTGWLIAGLALLWLGGLGLALEWMNLAYLKRLMAGSDGSPELLIAAFCFLAVVLGALFAWRGLRRAENRPASSTDRSLTVASGFVVAGMALLFIVFNMVTSADRLFLSEQSAYVRSAPLPAGQMPRFPIPPAAQERAPIEPGGRYLSGRLVGSIDHLGVGDIFITLSPAQEGAPDQVRAVLLTIQPVECMALSADGLQIMAVEKSTPQVKGPFPMQGGRFLAQNDLAVVQGMMVSPEEMMGTAHARYTDPATGQVCDLGTFEWDAFVTQ